TIRFILELDSSPTGTPTVAVEQNGTSILAATNMTVVSGTNNLIWYYDYTTDSAAVIGAYQVKYSAVIDGVTRYAYEHYDVSLKSVDDVDSAVSAVPTVVEIDAQLTTFHGSGAWTDSGVGAGAYNATIHVQDGGLNDVSDAYVTVHNAADADTPIIASGTTDANGKVILNIDGNVYIRASKAGFNFTSTAHNIASSATYSVSGTVISYSAPTDPELCRLYIYPITLDNASIVDLAASLTITSRDVLTKVNGEFVKNASMSFTYDATTTPDSYYFDALQGANVQITCDPLGIDHDLLVPLEVSKDLNDLVSS
ncbi:hypothetical protein ACFL2A_06550, partial [Thermodesulfobacteriota bacterium]